ncbi:MAG TPA: hypothetical protein VFA26_05335 [Gemmataceae bacterium]|nr:hypothetical protein [Gemmataceae bacterium]
MATISLVFRQSTPLGVEPAVLKDVLQRYADLVGVPWGVSCQVVVGEQPGAWPLYFLDDAGQDGVLGEHDDPDAEGPRPPEGFVYVRTARQYGEPVSVVAGHELAELLVDPATNLAALSPRERWVALEVCDPVQAHTFTVGGLAVPDFVLPAWFGGPGSRFDHLGHCTAAWQLLPGGYVLFQQNGRWSQLFADEQARARFQRRAGRFRRPARRIRKTRTP